MMHFADSSKLSQETDEHSNIHKGGLCFVALRKKDGAVETGDNDRRREP